MTVQVPFGDWPSDSTWTQALADYLQDSKTRDLNAEIDRRRQTCQVFPPCGETFQAFALTPPEQVRCVILGQDPYHGTGQAHGLCFSVRSPTPPPPSLRNIFKELRDDIGCKVNDSSGELTSWAQQGVLLLNTVLTVEEGKANSHRGLGWELFTDAAIKFLASQEQPIAFVLWGAPAQKKKKLLQRKCHVVIESPHPSPLSSYRGFFGSKPFSRVNEFLAQQGVGQIDWTL
ncbi:MAG: uracil-DNA glycosylase [Pirellulaceae bacterium]